MKTILITRILKRLLSAFLSERLIIGALKIIVHRTKAQWDDEVIWLVDSLLKDDIEGVQLHALNLVALASDELLKEKLDNAKA